MPPEPAWSTLEVFSLQVMGCNSPALYDWSSLGPPCRLPFESRYGPGLLARLSRFECDSLWCKYAAMYTLSGENHPIGRLS